MAKSKKCSACKEIKPSSEFYRKRKDKDWLVSMCIKCHNEHQSAYNRRRYQEDPEFAQKQRDISKKHNQRYRFKAAIITSKTIAARRNHAPCSASVKEIKRSFTGLCHACGITEEEHLVATKQRLHMDHCHVTGMFRGWLCGGCNRALGSLQDSVSRAIALSQYIAKFTGE